MVRIHMSVEINISNVIAISHVIIIITITLLLLLTTITTTTTTSSSRSICRVKDQHFFLRCHGGWMLLMI